jgi:hypothetical protein
VIALAGVGASMSREVARGRQRLGARRADVVALLLGRGARARAGRWTWLLAAVVVIVGVGVGVLLYRLVLLSEIGYGDPPPATLQHSYKHSFQTYPIVSLLSISLTEHKLNL